MKKIFAVILALCFISTTVIPVFAQGAAHHKKLSSGIETIYGAVVSVDKEKGELVVKEDKTGDNKTFQVNEKTALAVKEGQRVMLRVKTGSSVVESISVAHLKQKK